MSVRDLPAVAELTEQQQRGWVCVWCSTELHTGTARDLGEQRHRPADGAAYSWFPRACPNVATCARREANR